MFMLMHISINPDQHNAWSWTKIIFSFFVSTFKLLTILWYFFPGENRGHGLYNTHRLRYKGQVAQCSKCTAISLTVFVFSVIFLSSLALAFIRPFDFTQECRVKDAPQFIEVIDHDDYEYYEQEVDLKTEDGTIFPWDDIRLPKFIKPVRYDIGIINRIDSLK